MNVESVNDEEDFPVFKAGPPLPIRTKSRHNSKKKHVPLKATAAINTSASKCTPFTKGTTSTTTAQINTESKVKQYIERVKASDEIGRQKRIKPEQMLSLEELYQVNATTTSDGQHLQHPPAEVETVPDAVSGMHVKLRETLRIVKEKDELINKLRESCHNLAIKCADAENRVDELRFSYGRSSSSVSLGKQQRGSGWDGEISSLPNFHESVSIRRCLSVEDMHQARDSIKNNEGRPSWGVPSTKADKATETVVEAHDVQTQVGTMCQDEVCKRQALKLADHWQPEDGILQETCSNWLEKIQNWKTDSHFNLSQDSCGDRDSGFRGSAEIETESVRRHQRRSSITRSKHNHHQLHGGRLHKIPQRSSNNLHTQTTQLSSSTTIMEPGTDHYISSHQHFWPSFSTSQLNLPAEQLYDSLHDSNSTKAKSLFYELAEAKRNKCQHFQGECTTRNRLQLTGAKSLDVLYVRPISHTTTDELKSLIDSSFEPPEFILKSHLSSQHRSISQKVKMLDPLLDDTTKIALRVKKKSERLAQMLQDACTFE